VNPSYVVKALEETRRAATQTIGHIDPDPAAADVSPDYRKQRLGQALETPVGGLSLPEVEALAAAAIGVTLPGAPAITTTKKGKK